MNRRLLAACAGALLLVPAVLSAGPIDRVASPARDSSERVPASRELPGSRVAGKANDAVGQAWIALQERARTAWDRTATTIKEITRKPQKDVVITAALPGALSAKLLIGTPIVNRKEGRIGAIADVVLGKDSRVDAIVISDGGLFGIGNVKLAVKPALISIGLDRRGRIRAVTDLTGQHLEEAAISGAFKTPIEAMRDDYKKPEWRTVSRLLGAIVVGPRGQPVGAVSDVLLSPAGEAQFALLSIDGTMGVGTKLVAVTVGSLHFKSAGEPVGITMSTAQLNALAPVRSVSAFAN